MSMQIKKRGQQAIHNRESVQGKGEESLKEV